MDISVVIPSFNGLEYLEEYIPKVIASLKSSPKYKSELIIIDDKSSDDTIKILSEKYKNEPMVKIDSNPRKGACSARNYGVSISSGKYILFIDNDVTLEENFLEKVIPHFDDENVGIVACAIYYMTDNRQLDGVKIIKWRRGFFRFTSNILNNDLKVQDEYLSYGAQGACFLCTRKAFDKVDGINEILEPYLLEETDLIYKVMKQGYKIVYEPTTRAMHRWGGTVTTKLSERTKYLSIRNKYLFVYVHMHSKLMMLEHFIMIPFRMFSSDHRKAYKELFNMRHEIIECRKKEISRSIVSDDDILKKSYLYELSVRN